MLLPLQNDGGNISTGGLVSVNLSINGLNDKLIIIFLISRGCFNFNSTWS